METLNQYKSLALGLCVTILLLAMPFLYHRPFRTVVIPVTPAVAPAPAEMTLPKPKKVRVAHKPASAAPAKAANPEDIHMIRLNTFARQYTAVFSGRVTCNNNPCAADIDLIIQTSRNEDIQRHARSLADGTYSLEFPVIELPHEQMDWKIVARNSSAGSAEAHGQQILLDEHLSIESDVHIQ